jgi:glycerol uptake facilitator-like aquaporin
LVAEAVGTFIFGFGVAAAVNGVYEGTKLATVIGGSLALGILAASLGSNGVVNPAVALSLNSMSWAYAVGPLVGAVLGMWAHELMFAPASTKRKK